MEAIEPILHFIHLDVGLFMYLIVIIIIHGVYFSFSVSSEDLLTDNLENLDGTIFFVLFNRQLRFI